MRNLLVLPALTISLLAQAPPTFRPLRLFGDHMVLPPQLDVPIRGFGAPGAKVEVVATWGKQAATVVPADGRWSTVLSTPERGGPFEVTLRSGQSELVLRDVLVGDVWLGSGQSNMEMPIGNHGGWQGGVRDYEAEIAAAKFPELRVFTVERATSGVPLDDVEGSWQVCSPATAGTFSACAYFFGRELLQRGKAPLGLVVSSWGGTVCEAWTSETGLAAFPEFTAALAATRPTADQASPAERLQAFWNAMPSEGTGTAATVELPEVWSKVGLGGFDGVAFYSCKVTLPPALAGHDLWLELGAIDDMDTVWCNGEKVGGLERDGAWSTPRRYQIPAALGKGGSFELKVRVVDTGGEGGFTAPAATLRLVLAADPQQFLPLAGRWSRQLGPELAALPSWPRDEQGNPNRPAVLWNAMMAPLVPFPFTGAIWYQGESNIGRAEQYAKLFPAMILDWRRAFARPLPFYFVQIAPFGYTHADEDTALLREAQAAALQLPHTGMVVTLDVGEARDIHPRDKQSVGKRLALHALRDHYGDKVVSDGPRPRLIERDGQTLRVVFEAADGGLAAEGPVTGFEIAGADGVFAPAVVQLGSDAVVLRSEQVALPMRVRYGWANVPVANLKNGLGLPARPFRGQAK